MRVLNCLHRADFGGSQRRVVWVAERLKKRGIDTVILFPSGGGGRYDTWLAERNSVYIQMFLPVIRKASRIGANLLFIITLPIVVINFMRIMRELKIDLVHVNGVTNLQPVLAALMMRKPILWHWNDMLTPSLFVRIITPLLRSRLISLAVATPAIIDHYAFIHRAARQHVVIRAPIPPIENCCKNVVRDQFDSLNIPDNAIVLGFVGNLLPAKGCQDYLEAMSILCQRDSLIYGVMVGGELPGYAGYLHTLEQSIMEKNLSGRIHMVGFQQDVRSWLSFFDLLLFPSHSEACPITVLEAMQIGIPVVPYNVGDVPEMIKDTGLSYFDIGDIDGLVSGASDLLELPASQWVSIKKCISERVEQNYSLDIVSGLHFKNYLSLFHR